MKIACITYRSWASEIYNKLAKTYDEHEFLLIHSKENFSEEGVKSFKPDIILWYGWSWMISNEFVDNYESIMLHPSPLPKYRGGSPIQNQIINGETKSAVTLFRMTKELDKGDIYIQQEISLNGYIEDIFERIIKVGYETTCKVFDGEYILTPQKEENATYYERRTPSESEITLVELSSKPGRYIYNKVRMLTGPYPRAFIRTSDGKKIIFQNVDIIE
ncbi:formyltransferase family protein [Gracilimonas halophila]|uniref:Formyltransferase family protein n=1 Tax=Gracilimonas halophila TaxID=1834464 RepID=A0ABW5JJP0_9BACT